MPLDEFMEMVQICCRMGGWKPSAAHHGGCLHPVDGKTHTFVKEPVRDVGGSKDVIQFIVAKTDTAAGWAAAHVKAVKWGVEAS